MKSNCPVCGQATLDEPGVFEICDICQWEDDPLQRENQTLAGGANHMSLNQAKAAYKKGIEIK